jgi:hypothetical protein
VIVAEKVGSSDRAAEAAGATAADSDGSRLVPARLNPAAPAADDRIG